MAGTYSPRRIYWPTRETVTDWAPSDTNTAGSIDIATDGAFVCGKRSRGQTLLWTTTDLWLATWIGGDFQYSFEVGGRHCGIISQRAAIVLDSGAYWMGAGKFFRFDGFVAPIECEVADYVFGDMNPALTDWIWALANPQFNEITWFYPSSAATAEHPIDRYVTYNYVEQHWTFGKQARTAGVTTATASGAPIMIGDDGKIYDHEVGTVQDGVQPHLESGPMKIGEGERVVHVRSFVPDDKTLGDVSLTLFGSFRPDDAEFSKGPIPIESKTSIRMTARQFRVRLQQAAATAWRVGVVQLGGVLGGFR